MGEREVLAFCCAFLVGTWFSALPEWQGELLLGGIGGIGIVIMPFLWRRGLKRWAWMVVTLVSLFACFYVSFREPVAATEDVVTKAPLSGVTIVGKVMDHPRLTRNGRARFVLEAESLKQRKQKNGQRVSGKLYTTTSITQVTGIRPGQKITITGNLYKPNPPKNPGQFDFRRYLQRQGIFAGLTSYRLAPQTDPPWGVWWIRERIVRAHVMGAGMPGGALLSSIVLGSRAVDLPSEVKETFVEVGLAHALAASGFHVAVVLGVVLLLFRQVPPRQQFVIGTLSLIGYLLLTGISPSLLRAAAMGMGALTGKLTDRKGRPLTGLLCSLVIVLLINPLWIWDLGFQFSFLATLGLIVSVNPIVQNTLAGIPPLLATAIAVPEAAFLWTLPLQLYAIGGFSAYALLANVLTAPLFVFLIWGSLLSGALGVFMVPLGALVSWLLKPVALLTLGITATIAQLPGNLQNPSSLDLWQLIAAYGLLGSIWLLPWWQGRQHWRHLAIPRWVIGGVIYVLVLFVPLAIGRSTTLQTTLLDAGQAPVMLIQSQGRHILINTGSRKQAGFTLVNLLQKEGIHHIDWGIATHTQADINGGWSTLLENNITLDRFWEAKGVVVSQVYQQLTRDLNAAGISPTPLEEGKWLSLDKNFAVQLLQASPVALQIRVRNTLWLLIGDMDIKQQRLLLRQKERLKSSILWWSGGPLLPDLVQVVNPEIAVASGIVLKPSLQTTLEDQGLRVFSTDRDGAILWTENDGVYPLRDREEKHVL